MIITLSLGIGILLSLVAAFFTYLVSRIDFFRSAFEILAKYELPEKPKTKGDWRRYRKIKPLIMKARRKIFLLFFVHLTIFLITYTATINLVLYMTPPEQVIVSIPISIPLLTGKGDGYYITHVLFLALIGYLVPSYLLVRAVRSVSMNR